MIVPRPTLTEQVSAMSREELVQASVKFGGFNSPHEGWAVIREEIEEASDEINAMFSAHAALWGDVKLDRDGRANAEAVAAFAERAACELIQVAAMGRRYLRDVDAGATDEPGPRTDASGPDMWPDDRPTSARPSAALWDDVGHRPP